MADAKTRFQFATICYDAAAMMVWGFLTIDALLSARNAFNDNPGLSQTVWGASIAMVVLGFVMIVAAFLVTSARAANSNTGGVIGAVFSVLGVLVAIYLVHSLSSLNFYGSDFSYTYTVLGLPVVLFAGFPLGLMGSLWAIRNSRMEGEPEPATSEAKTLPAA
jgi:hypothetical protein